MPLSSVSRSGVVIRSPLNPVSTIQRDDARGRQHQPGHLVGRELAAARPVVVGAGQRIEPE